MHGSTSSCKTKYLPFKLPSPARGDREETASLKNNARIEWLRVILRTREMTPDLMQRIEKTQNLPVCKRHFKVEFIVDRKY